MQGRAEGTAGEGGWRNPFSKSSDRWDPFENTPWRSPPRGLNAERAPKTSVGIPRDSTAAAALSRTPVVKRPLLCLAGSVAFCAGCGSSSPESAPSPPGAAPGSPWFREVAAERGLEFRHVRGDEQRHWFPEIMGAGVGLFDYDGDGTLDCYLVQSGDLRGPRPEYTNRLYRNKGKAHFEDVTERVGGGDTGYGMGCIAGDIDGDGRMDLYVTNVGPNVLYHNVLHGNGQAGARLDDISIAAGVDHPGWATSGTFLDSDADGDLDLFFVNYLRWSAEREKECVSEQGENDYCSPRSYEAPAPDVLYRNEGDGTFVDITKEAGLGKTFGNGLGAVAADFDGDGHIDIYVANDMMPNQLWKNRADGTFEDVALFAGCAANQDGASEASMGTVAVDIENDGDLDIFLTHLRHETNTFYRNQGGVFSDRTAALGLATPSRIYTGFGVGFGDFDHDGVLDLFIANGAVTRNRPPMDPGDPYAEPNQLYRGEARKNGASIRFTEVLPRSGLSEERIRASRGTALGDLDDDGDLDIVVVDNHAHVALLENIAPEASAGNSIQLRLVTGGHAAIGAAARIQVAGKTQWRTVLPGTSYCSSNETRLHFGLGTHTAPVDVRVRWSDGQEESFGPLEVGQTHVLARSASESD